MWRRFSRAVVCAIGLVVVVGAARIASAQTADEIVARNLEAKGGLEKIRAVQTVKQTETVIVQGVHGTLTLYAKRPNLSRHDMVVTLQNQTFTMTDAFDGTSAWGVNPMAGVTAPAAATGAQADEVRRQADFDGPFVDAKAKGNTITLVGTEPLGAATVYHLKVVDKQGQQTQYYLDTKTALEVKVVHQVPTMGDVEQELGDYRDVGGLKFPFSIRTSSGGQVIIEMTVEKTEVNVPIEDAFFKMPVK